MAGSSLKAEGGADRKKTKESRDRLFGVKVIVAFFLLKTAALGVALLVAMARPQNRAASLGFMAQLAPLLQLMHGEMTLRVAPAFVVLGLAIVLGVWFMREWAWAILLFDRGIPLFNLAQFLVVALLFDRKWLSLLPSSPYFAIDVVSSIFIVYYLVQPDVRRAFGVTG